MPHDTEQIKEIKLTHEEKEMMHAIVASPEVKEAVKAIIKNKKK